MADGNFNKRVGLLSNVLLFQMIFTFKRKLVAEAFFRRRRALFTSTFAYNFKEINLG